MAGEVEMRLGREAGERLRDKAGESSRDKAEEVAGEVDTIETRLEKG